MLVTSVIRSVRAIGHINVELRTSVSEASSVSIIREIEIIVAELVSETLVLNSDTLRCPRAFYDTDAA
jgi:hypothetical protein